MDTVFADNLGMVLDMVLNKLLGMVLDNIPHH
jgi:hypothetical protein